MDECEESEQENCGRFTFREADLAYLLVDEERMFPLAELLASLFSNTARTTLFTRMEKINTRRHFCSAEEIKLLKTVNGIHGSSAICTLIPEADVEKYCAVYIDRTLELKLLTKGKRTRKESAKTKDSNWIKGGVTEDSNLTAEANANEEKTATNSNVGNDKVNRAINSSKRKNQPSSNKQKMNDDGAKAKVSWEGQDSLSLSNHSQLLGECSEIREDPNSSATLAEPDVTNGSILTLSSEHAVKARKKRKAKDCLEGANFTKDNFGQNKRSKNKDEADNIRSPSKASRAEHCIVQSTDVNGNTSLAGPRCCSTDNSLEHPYGSTLSQCLTNANSEILFSDSSSNDSGFASTTTSESSAMRHNSSVCKDADVKKASKITLTLPSPSKQSKNKKPKKTKLDNSDFDCNSLDTEQREPSLSPPALVLKRQNNTWQVETKTEREQKPSETRIPSAAKKKLKWPISYVTDEDNVQFKNQEATCGKKIGKKKEKRPNSISDKDKVGVESKRNVVKKRRKRKPQKDKSESVEGSGVINIVDSSTKKSNLSKTPGTSKEIKRLSKNNTNQNSKQIKEAQTSNSYNNAKPTMNSANTDNSLQHSKKAIVAKTLKANKNFKFMSLFSSFPFLSVKDGDLYPSSSETVAENTKKPSSHPIWKWHLGGPIFVHETSARKTHINK